MLKKLMFLLALALAAPAWADADPTTHQVYEAVEAGRLGQAQEMIGQVLRDHPRSGKAHYVAAEVYARQGLFPVARQELATAEALEPGLSFAKAASVAALKRELSLRGRVPAGEALPSTQSSLFWPMGLAVVAAVAIIWFVTRRRTPPAGAYSAPYALPYEGGSGAAATSQSPGAGPVPGLAPAGSPAPAPNGGAPNFGAANVGGGIGTGIAASLASGLAVGAGVVAGEALAHHFIDGDRREGYVPPLAGQPAEPAPNADLGGPDFGITGDDSWDDDNGTSVDSDGWN